MDRESSWQVIAEQRRGIARMLDGLPAQDWERPSLCTGWRIRDVAAHVAMAPLGLSLRTLLVGAIRVRGDFDRLNHDLAVAHADRSPDELVAELQRYADSRTLPVITTPENLVFDVMVHAQDIAIPLDHDHAMPVEAAHAGADRVWTMGWPFWARRRLRGLRLVATDTDWAVGKGTEVRGPIAPLLLLLTGRTAAALPRLSGPGVKAIRPFRT